jgi:hypothetical protein
LWLRAEFSLHGRQKHSASGCQVPRCSGAICSLSKKLVEVDGVNKDPDSQFYSEWWQLGAPFRIIPTDFYVIEIAIFNSLMECASTDQMTALRQQRSFNN